MLHTSIPVLLCKTPTSPCSVYLKEKTRKEGKKEMGRKIKRDEELEGKKMGEGRGRKEYRKRREVEGREGSREERGKAKGGRGRRM